MATQEELDEQANRPSLLDVVIDEYNQEKEYRTSRFLLTGQLNPNNGCRPEDASAFFHHFIQALPRDAKLTGYSVVAASGSQPALVALIEAPTPTLLSLLRQIAGKHLHKERGSKEERKSAHGFSMMAGKDLLVNARVCSFTEEVPREYTTFAFRTLKRPGSEFVLPKAEEHLDLVFGVLRGLLEVGRETQGMANPEKAKAFLEGDDKQELLDAIPSAAKIGKLHLIKDLSSPAEYLDVYDTPVDFTLESEKVWPAEPFLKY